MSALAAGCWGASARGIAPTVLQALDVCAAVLLGSMSSSRLKLHKCADVNHPGLAMLDPANLVHEKQLMDWHWIQYYY
eukprot:4595942-Amphidinium_carterae.3